MESNNEGNEVMQDKNKIKIIRTAITISNGNELKNREKLESLPHSGLRSPLTLVSG